MTFTRAVVIGALALFGFVCWLAASGFGAAREGLISLVALVVLVGGGNLLAGRAGHYGRRPPPPMREPAPTETGALDAGPFDEPAP